MARRLSAGLIGFAVLALALLMGGGGWWLVARLQASGLKMADQYFVHAAPFHLTRVESDAGNQWQASTVCGNSEQPIGLQDAAHYLPARGDALERAAQSLGSRLGGSGEDGQTENDLAQDVRQWPTEQIWVDLPRGILVAIGPLGRTACLLVTTVPLSPEPPH
ncbi:hypothetical protein [Deinococcus ruber]|nr:hypothetical protein [Deinococcus ruber]